MKKFEPLPEDINNLAKSIMQYLNSYKLKRSQKHKLLDAAVEKIRQTYPIKSRNELVEDMTGLMIEKFENARKEVACEMQSDGAIDDDMINEAMEDAFQTMEGWYE